jgi:hypothetical protein
MAIEDISDQKQVLIEKFLEGEPAAHQIGESIWDLGKNFTSYPDVSLEQIDKAVIDELNGKGAVYIDGNKVNVVVGGSERWAIARKTYLLDKNMKIILPQIAIRIGDTEFDSKRWAPTDKEGVTELTIKTIIKTSDNNITNPNEATERVISISPPTPIVCNYTVTVWCNFMRQLREICGRLLKHFSSNAVYVNEFFFTTELSPSVTIQDNFDDYGTAERVIKGQFSFKVDAYLIDEKNYKIQNKIMNSKMGIFFGEKIMKAEDVKWRDPYKIPWKKL